MEKHDKEPLFTLTAKDAEIARKIFLFAKTTGQYMYEKALDNGNGHDALLDLAITICANDLITRIKQWQDEIQK